PIPSAYHRFIFFLLLIPKLLRRKTAKWETPKSVENGLNRLFQVQTWPKRGSAAKGVADSAWAKLYVPLWPAAIVFAALGEEIVGPVTIFGVKACSNWD